MAEEKSTYAFETLSAPLTLRAAGNGGTPAPDGAAILGTPPLRMVLVHFSDGRGDSTLELAPGPVESIAAGEQAAVRLIVRLIEHLKEQS